jgi:hypothetical protein
MISDTRSYLYRPDPLDDGVWLLLGQGAQDALQAIVGEDPDEIDDASGGTYLQHSRLVTCASGWSGRRESNPHRELGKLPRVVRGGPPGSKTPSLTCQFPARPSAGIRQNPQTLLAGC